MKIVLLTTSYGQILQIEKLLSSLSKYVQDNPGLSIHCCIVESLVDVDCYDYCVDRFSCLFKSFKVLRVDSANFWTGSVFCGLKYLYALSEKFRSLSSSRVILMNCDVLPSSWEFLLSPKAALETLATIDKNKVVNRSGFCVPFPFVAYHYYPYNKKTLPNSDWLCKAVPTRLVVFPFAGLSLILSHEYLVRQLPHYSADFVVTSLLAAKLSARWCVRTDTTLLEDTSTTGLKSYKSVKFCNSRVVLFGRKSVFNVKDAFFFPVLFSRLSLPSYCVLSYVLSFWCKYALKVLMLFFFNAFNCFCRGRLL